MELLKLHELSRQWFYVGFICDGGCESTVLAIKSLGFVIKFVMVVAKVLCWP